jgi:hypothetical protein
MSTNGNGKAPLNWPTVVLILFTGGANLIGTHSGNAGLSAEQQEGLRRIRELHNELDDFKRWQQQASDNQRKMIENDSKLLEEVHRIAVRLDRLKSIDEMRGVPE